MRKILALASAVVLCSAAAAVAAVTNGTYAGTSTVMISGVKATHPFSVTIKKAHVTKVSLIDGASCGTLAGTSGIKANLAIGKSGHFAGTLKAGDWSVKLQGAFKGKNVSGSFTGTFKERSLGCSAPKNSFKAHR
jgi:hypothetical protein